MSDYARLAEDVLCMTDGNVPVADHASRVMALASDIQLSVETWLAANPPPTTPVICPECDGVGQVLDAPNRVFDGVSYMTTCEECKGSGRQ